MMTPLERFLSYVIKTDSCWLWAGSITTPGYGSFWSDGRMVGAHRFMWEAVNGPVPSGLDLDHLCVTRHCVRPDHLRAVTRSENLLAAYRDKPRRSSVVRVSGVRRADKARIAIAASRGIALEVIGRAFNLPIETISGVVNELAAKPL